MASITVHRPFSTLLVLVKPSLSSFFCHVLYPFQLAVQGVDLASLLIVNGAVRASLYWLLAKKKVVPLL